MTTQSQFSHPKYRPDIDGLRALSVLAVVVYHAFPNWLKGGFIGVDVFFVISGYLISTIIFDNFNRDTFSLRQFYARRIKRILPALLLVLAFCFALGWFLLRADEYKQLGKHIASGAAFVSNLTLWSESGYFDNSAESKPLLHLWSLGVEEQFYIVWPLLVWIAVRLKIRLFVLLALLIGSSFAYSLYLVLIDQVAAFYSPIARFWEIMIGALLANTHLAIGRAGVKTLMSRLSAYIQHYKNHLSSFSLLLLISSFVLIDEHKSFPGFWALLPVLGAMGLIASGPDTWINRVILSNRIAVFFGLISFPLYLWHWPLLTFAYLINGETPHREIRVLLVLASVGLAWATYRFVECPVRARGGTNVKVSILVTVLIGVGAVGYLTYRADGLESRPGGTTTVLSGDTAHEYFFDYMGEHYYECAPPALADNAPVAHGYPQCFQSKSHHDVDIAIIGDSHAEHIFPGIAEALPAKNVAYYLKGGMPFVDDPLYGDIYQHIVSSPSITKVILSVYWYDRYDDMPEGSSLENEIAKIATFLTENGKIVYLMDDVPSFPFLAASCKDKRWARLANNSCTAPVTFDRELSVLYLKAFDTVVSQVDNVKVLLTKKYFCNDIECSMTNDNTIYYRDSNHLNIEGSIFLGERLASQNPSLTDF